MLYTSGNNKSAQEATGHHAQPPQQNVVFLNQHLFTAGGAAQPLPLMQSPPPSYSPTTTTQQPLARPPQHQQQQQQQQPQPQQQSPVQQSAPHQMIGSAGINAAPAAGTAGQMVVSGASAVRITAGPLSSASAVEATDVLQSALGRAARENQAALAAAMQVRQQLQQAQAERDAARAEAESLRAHVIEIQRVAQRFTTVQEPVVASDGFTYERTQLESYLAECASTEVQPTSHLTHEALQTTFVPNLTLKRLVELLRRLPTVQESAAVAPSSVSPSASSPGVTGTSDADHLNTRAARAARSVPQAPGQPPRLHPCLRVYGYCNFNETCAFSPYPYEACLSHLKGKCRFGATCHELHIDFQPSRPNAAAHGSVIVNSASHAPQGLAASHGSILAGTTAAYAALPPPPPMPMALSDPQLHLHHHHQHQQQQHQQPLVVVGAPSMDQITSPVVHSQAPSLEYQPPQYLATSQPTLM